MKPIISLAVVDDHQLFRKGLIALIKDFPELKISIEAANGKELLEQLKNKKVDVVLLDLEMPEMDGFETTEKIRIKYPDIKIIIITQHNEDELISDLIAKGANGFLLKNQDIEIVVDAIYGVIENGYFFNEKTSNAMVNTLIKSNKIKPIFNEACLTKREIEIIRLISKECTNKEIADALIISVRTVEGHKERILEKTNTKNSVGIAIYALKHKLI